MSQKLTVPESKDLQSRIHNIEINSRHQYRVFFRTLQNGLHVIKHDQYFWHRVTSGIKHPQSTCVLRDKINRRLKGWKGAVFSVSHHLKGDLWVTLQLPDCFCPDCGVYIKRDTQRCLSCACYARYKAKSFHDDYDIKTLTVDFGPYKGRFGTEKAYRMAKMLGMRERLDITHADCSTPLRCGHVRGALLFKFSAGALPQRAVGYRFSIVGTTTRIVGD